ncbi:hypothetical protein BRD00_03105 [Halobacteriales archaeon QS_8_69_26]|nr:MAG: hypothetical protein BRD00_03105 [Halobacteriales archaeon QS_8_69_26]
MESDDSADWGAGPGSGPETGGRGIGPGSDRGIGGRGVEPGSDPGFDGSAVDVAVVDAGISGLALTHFCERRGLDVATFEAGSEPGGVVRTRTVDGRPLAVGREGMGCLVPDDGYALLGSTWNADAFGRDRLYTCYLGGAANPGAVGWSDDRLGRVAAREFADVTGAEDPRVLSVARVRPGMPAYDRSWAALEGLELPGGIAVCANYAARAGIPGRVREARATAERLSEGGPGGPKRVRADTA